MPSTHRCVPGEYDRNAEFMDARTFRRAAANEAQAVAGGREGKKKTRVAHKSYVRLPTEVIKIANNRLVAKLNENKQHEPVFNKDHPQRRPRPSSNLPLGQRRAASKKRIVPRQHRIDILKPFFNPRKHRSDILQFPEAPEAPKRKSKLPPVNYQIRLPANRRPGLLDEPRRKFQIARAARDDPHHPQSMEHMLQTIENELREIKITIRSCKKNKLI